MKLYFTIIGLFAVLGVAVTQDCLPTQFECANKKCILASYKCDGDDDCGDWSDEPPKINPDLCPACYDSWFRCSSGRCVPGTYVCDMDLDCEDGSDEKQECPSCPDDRFACPSGGCIKNSDTCNGNNDCKDWSDESIETCPCSDSEMRCAATNPPGEPGPPGKCIPGEMWCDDDGIWDCIDGSDQANCTNVQIKPSERRLHDRVTLTDLIKSVGKGK